MPHPSSVSNKSFAQTLSEQVLPVKKEMEEIRITSSPSFSALLRDISQKHKQVLFNTTLKALDVGFELVLLSNRGIFPLCTTFCLASTKLTLWTPKMLIASFPPSTHVGGEKDGQGSWSGAVGKSKAPIRTQKKKSNSFSNSHLPHNYLHKFCFAEWDHNPALPSFVMCEDLV